MITFVTKGRGQPLPRQYYRGRVLVDPAQGMSAFGQDPKGLEAKPASPVAKRCAHASYAPPERGAHIDGGE